MKKQVEDTFFCVQQYYCSLHVCSSACVVLNSQDQEELLLYNIISLTHLVHKLG